jgi:hypothetical protein
MLSPNRQKINNSNINCSEFSDQTTAQNSNIEKQAIKSNKIASVGNFILTNNQIKINENKPKNNKTLESTQKFNLLEDLMKSVEALENKPEGVESQSEGNLTDRITFLTNIMEDKTQINQSNKQRIEDPYNSIKKITTTGNNKEQVLSLNNSKENLQNEEYNPYDIAIELDVGEYENKRIKLQPKSLRLYNINKKEQMQHFLWGKNKYNQISSFAEKFSQELSRISPSYTKNHGSNIMNEIENNIQLKKFWDKSSNYDQYRNLKVVKFSDRYPNRMQSLSPKNSNFEKLGNRVYKF